MRQRRLELRPHGLAVGFERLIVTLHLDELLGARKDGRNCRDEANGLEVVGAAADVREGRANILDERGQLELCCSGVEDVKTPGQGKKGDGEVHFETVSLLQAWVKRRSDPWQGVLALLQTWRCLRMLFDAMDWLQASTFLLSAS